MIDFNKIARKIDHVLHPAKGVVLMLHRVTNERSQLEQNRRIEITPDFLEKTILEYQLEGYVFVSIDEVVEMLVTQSFPKQPFVCFTFDDGYKDNLIVAAPFFRKYNVPYCIYVTTSFIDRTAALWWYVLEDIIMFHDRVFLSDGRTFDSKTKEEKETVFSVLHDEFVFTENVSVQAHFDSLFHSYTYSWSEMADKMILSLSNLQELANDPLCTIGAHTINHRCLPKLSYQDQLKEIIGSKQSLSLWINRDVRHFSYPYGLYNENSIKIMVDEFSSAAKAYGGSVRKNTNLFEVPRLFLYEQ